MTSPLEHCPFCGTTPDDLIFDEGSTFRWLAWSCPGCGIGSEERIQTLGKGDPAQWLLDAKDRARAAWNRRPAAADAALAAQGEPIAWMWQHDETGRTGFVAADFDRAHWAEHNPRLKIIRPVYDAPVAAPVAQPLTDEHIARLVLQTVYEGDASTPHREAWAAEIGTPFARAIERAHGIESKEPA